MQSNQLAFLSWDEFKDFLNKNLRESEVFIVHMWGKFREDSQQQQKEVQDWAVYLEDLQSILV